MAPPSECVSPPLGTKREGEQHLLPGEGTGEPVRMTGEKAWHSVYPVALIYNGYTIDRHGMHYAMHPRETMHASKVDKT